MGITKLYIALEMHMTDNRFLKKAIEISRILGIHDRTITRWSLKGEVEKQGRGKYCILSVFKYYRQQLLEQIASLNQRIENANHTQLKKSLQQQKLESSIKIISTNAQIKEHELKVLQDNLVNRKEAEKVYRHACQGFSHTALGLPPEVAEEISQLDNPNLINSLLQTKIEELLTSMSI